MPGLRRYGALDDEERSQRPASIRPLSFEELTTPGPQFRDTSGVVPIESVRTGDTQVLAARGVRTDANHAIDLDVLADFPSVTSVVATTLVRAARPLPTITDLLLFSGAPLPDAETIGNLPCLSRLWLTWCRGRPFDLGALPSNLQALGIASHLVAAPKTGDRFALLQRFEHLRHLTLRYCLPKESVRSIAALTRLVTLDCDAPAGWGQLRYCAALEDVTAIQPRMANLRPLRTWTRLKRLALVSGAGLRSLDGLESFGRLERLRLVLVRGQKLSPIAHLPRLEDVSVNSFGHPVPLDVFTTLPSLSFLTIETPGDPADVVRFATLQPLASIRNLKTLTLRGVETSGGFEQEIDELRRLRPDIDIRAFRGPGPPAGERVGIVLVRPPAGRSSDWWIRENLASHLSVATNHEAEARVRRAIAAADPALAARLTYDTEADAVCIYGAEADLREIAGIVTRLASASAHLT
ncbi:MAG TPA: hypothetical protein VL484_15455 [Vicinamibacterales bacterium]|jgi:hypothetical protein|nr:hypothetical protein [Vicinamibacterales bacterium]